MGRYLWAVPAVGRPDPKSCSSYAELPRVGNVLICGNRGWVRWRVQGWQVFLKPALDRKRLAQLVRLTEVVPAP
jgi:hypothetical protein